MLRAGAGVFSAWALVCASSWCLDELARRHVPQLGAWIYTGVGLGIAVTGALAWLGGRQPADRLWLGLGLVAVAGAMFVWLGSQDRSTPSASAGARASPSATQGTKQGHLLLVLCYGAFGFGYIVPATFLPAMAQQLVPDPLVFGLTWPLFGLAAALSVAAAARWLPSWPRRRVWALAQGLMALGTALPAAAQSPVGAGGIGRARRRNVHGGHHGRSAAGPRAGSCQSDAAAGPDDGRLRCRADRRTRFWFVQSAPAAGPAGMRWPGPVPSPPCCWPSPRRGYGEMANGKDGSDEPCGILVDGTAAADQHRHRRGACPERCLAWKCTRSAISWRSPRS